MLAWQKLDPRNLNWGKLGEQTGAMLWDKQKLPLILFGGGCLALLFSCVLCSGVIRLFRPAPESEVAVTVVPKKHDAAHASLKLEDGTSQELDAQDSRDEPPETGRRVLTTVDDKRLFANGPVYLTDADLKKTDRISFDNEEWRTKREVYDDESLWAGCTGVIYHPVSKKIHDRVVIIQCAPTTNVARRRQMFVQRRIDGRWSKHGLYQAWYAYGGTGISNYIHGEKEGESTEYFPTGEISQRDHWMSGKRHGRCEKWFEKGQKWIESDYRFGEPINSKFWDKEGNRTSSPLSF